MELSLSQSYDFEVDPSLHTVLAIYSVETNDTPKLFRKALLGNTLDRLYRLRNIFTSQTMRSRSHFPYGAKEPSDCSNILNSVTQSF